MTGVTARAELRTLQGKMADAVAVRLDADIRDFGCPLGDDATVPGIADLTACFAACRADLRIPSTAGAANPRLSVIQGLGTTLVGAMGSQMSSCSSDAEPILQDGVV